MVAASAIRVILCLPFGISGLSPLNSEACYARRSGPPSSVMMREVRGGPLLDHDLRRAPLLLAQRLVDLGGDLLGDGTVGGGMGRGGLARDDRRPRVGRFTDAD